MESGVGVVGWEGGGVVVSAAFRHCPIIIKAPRGLKANESGAVLRRITVIRCVGADARVKAREVHRYHSFCRTSTCISVRTHTDPEHLITP